MGVPFAGGGYGEFLSGTAEPRREDLVIGRVDYVSDGLHEALGARLVAGRLFYRRRQPARRPPRRGDQPDGGAALLPERRCRRAGRSTSTDPSRSSASSATSSIAGWIWRTRPRLYTTQARNPSQYSIVVGTTGDPARLAPDVARVMRAVDPGVAPVNVRALDAAMAESMTDRRVVSWIVLLFAAAALGLASLGVYGVMADAVSARRRELCLRIALGAGRSEVIRSVVTGGLVLAAIGLALGAAGAAAAARLLHDLLFEVRPSDPWVFGTAVATIAAVALLASFGPAIRATRLDALAALRE